jgi:hypothetical protein
MTATPIIFSEVERRILRIAKLVLHPQKNGSGLTIQTITFVAISAWV